MAKWNSLPPSRINYWAIACCSKISTQRANGTLKLEPEGAGTKVTWSFAGEAGRNPMMRYMGLMMDGMVGQDFEVGLANLKVLAERS